MPLNTLRSISRLSSGGGNGEGNGSEGGREGNGSEEVTGQRRTRVREGNGKGNGSEKRM